MHFDNLTRRELTTYLLTAWKLSKYRVFSGPYLPVFGLNTEIYSANLRFQSGCGKIRTRKNSVFGHFSRIGSGTNPSKNVVTKRFVHIYFLTENLPFLEHPTSILKFTKNTFLVESMMILISKSKNAKIIY